MPELDVDAYIKNFRQKIEKAGVIEEHFLTWEYEKYEYWTLLGKKFHVFEDDWLAPANYIEKTGTFGYPWCPCYFQITVESENKTVSRSGFSICNFVIMQDRNPFLQRYDFRYVRSSIIPGTLFYHAEDSIRISYVACYLFSLLVYQLM